MIGRLLLAVLSGAALVAPAAAQFTDVPAAYSAGAVPTVGAAVPGSQQPAAVKSSAAPVAPSGPPAKQVFGAVKAPAALEARAIGGYARGCLAGAQPLAIDGPAWQAMRLSRNRNWGHPDLIALVERLAVEAKAKDGWSGLLVGDISQPRGGPMLTGHASHQIGLDADIWLTPMPDRRLSPREREDLSATSMLGADQLSVEPKVWTARHVALIRRAASYRDVERVLVHPGIKQALCKAANLPADKAWLAKVRPYWGHHYHMHIRIACPKGSADCVTQAPIPGDDGCGKELEDWFKLLTAPPKPADPAKPPPPPMTVEQLPAACKVVLQSPAGIATATKDR
jgi:penicillin-insensitive murein endopeptidase